MSIIVLWQSECLIKVLLVMFLIKALPYTYALANKCRRSIICSASRP